MTSCDYIVVLTTCSNNEQAALLASELVKAQLAGCVQMSNIRSIYRWRGQVELAEEIQLTIKARLADYSAIEVLIKAKHSYENPQILAIPIIAGSQAYFDWLAEETH